MEIWIATGNKGKMAEFKLLFEKELPDLKIKSIADLPTFNAPPENGKTFLENALIKAKSLRAMKPDCWVLGEDAGLEVTALNNLPGIHTARYAGPHARDSENMAKLTKMLQMKGALDRSARFVATLACLGPDGAEKIFTGELKGNITKLPKGSMGFGYDPIFVPDGETLTLAELGPGFKTRKSHRALATLQFIEFFKAQNS